MRLVFNLINKDIFDSIKSGRKIVETRAATPKYKNLKQKELVVLVCGHSEFRKTISRVSYFKTIDQLLKVYKPQDINPELKTKEEIIDMYHSFPNYQEKIKECGIVAFELV